MAFEESRNREESLIPNSQIETMFLRIATDDQMVKYVKFVDEGHQSLATAYASARVFELFFPLVEFYERNNGNIEGLREETKKKRRGKK